MATLCFQAVLHILPDPHGISPIHRYYTEDQRTENTFASQTEWNQRIRYFYTSFTNSKQSYLNSTLLIRLFIALHVESQLNTKLKQEWFSLPLHVSKPECPHITIVHLCMQGLIWAHPMGVHLVLGVVICFVLLFDFDQLMRGELGPLGFGFQR